MEPQPCSTANSATSPTAQKIRYLNVFSGHSVFLQPDGRRSGVRQLRVGALPLYSRQPSKYYGKLTVSANGSVSGTSFSGLTAAGRGELPKTPCPRRASRRHAPPAASPRAASPRPSSAHRTCIALPWLPPTASYHGTKICPKAAAEQAARMLQNRR